MASAFSGARFKEFIKKYGKVGLGVHFTVSAASITGLYVAIKNNVDVEGILHKLHLPGLSDKEPHPEVNPSSGGVGVGSDNQQGVAEEKKRTGNRTAELVASSGGALALAILCNKALIPIRLPITLAVTPPLARFLARRRIIKGGAV